MKFKISFLCLNPIPTGHGWNQPIYERHVTKSGRNRVNNNVSMDHWHMSLEFFFLADCSYLLLFLFTVIQITESIMPTKARSLDESLLNFVKAVASCLLCGLNFARSKCLVCAKGSVFLIPYSAPYLLKWYIPFY